MKLRTILTRARFLATAALLASAFQTAIGADGPAETFHIRGRDLHTAAGEKVVLRGVNEMFVWSDDPTGKFIYPEIAKSGANVVRIVWSMKGDPATLDASIANCLSNGMIPMAELHDATGDFDKLPAVIDHWLTPAMLAVVKKHERWLLLNIANEAGGGKLARERYVAVYADAIRRFREAGVSTTLIIDASGWGQDERMILDTWRDLLDADPIRNVMFSVHTYWVENQQARLDELVRRVVDDEIPFLFGEGPQQVGFDCKSEFPWQNLLAQCQANDIGWIAWSWGYKDNGDCHPGRFDMTKDGAFGNWENDWGRGIVVDDPNSIANTSIRPPSLLAEYPESKR